MKNKPLIFFDPYPRNEEMVFTDDVKSELNKISNLVYHFGSRAPDELVEKNIEEIEILVGHTAMPKERLDKSKKIKAIINVKANWEPNIDYHEAHRRGIYVLSAAPAMAPAVAEACVGYAISLSRNILGVYKKFINSEDHLKRADYLAWERKYWDLKRMLKYLPKDERALYNARQILMSNSYGVDNAISKVPEHLKNDPGLEFDRLRWRNRRGRLESSLEVLFKNSNRTEILCCLEGV